MENKEDRVSIRSAVDTALDYVRSLYANNRPQDIMLEEVEFSETDNQWLITVGFSLPEVKAETVEHQPLVIHSKTIQALSRRYKVINIDAVTGEAVSMKIRAI
jgi:hypothetical protein